MAAIQSYRDLEAWQRAMDLADEGYDLVEILPRREMFGMASQMRRAFSSVPSNIAEGRKRSDDSHGGWRSRSSAAARRPAEPRSRQGRPVPSPQAPSP